MNFSSSRLLFHALLPLLLACALSAVAPAQWVDPRPRTHPILTPAAEMPAGAVRALAFGVDGNGQTTLYSGGDDKLVRRWLLVPDAQGGIALRPAGKILWPIYRDIRGVVYALDVRRDAQGERVAFGGVGAKPSQVNWLHAEDPQRQQVLVDANVQARNAVYTLAYHPRDAMQLAVGHDADRNVLLWRLDGEHPQQAESKLATACSVRVRHLAFSPDGSRLAIAGMNEKLIWSVEVWSVSPPQLLEAAVPLAAEVTGLTWLDSQIWQAATIVGIYDSAAKTYALQDTLKSADKNPALDAQIRGIARPAGHAPVVAIYDPARRETRVCLVDLAGNRITELANGVFLGPEPDVVLAATREGQTPYVAAAGLAQIAGCPAPLNVIRVWRATDGKLMAQVPDERTFYQSGGSIAQVGILAEGDSPAIGFCWGQFAKGAQAPFTHRFKLLPRGLEALPEGSRPVAAATPWNVLFDKQNPLFYYLVNPQLGKKAWGPLPVWGARTPKCCAVDQKSNYLALGYADGILVCHLPSLMEISQRGGISAAEKKALIDGTVVRSFFGHAGMVTSLAFSADASWLLSGSLDGTLSAWPLDGMTGNELGATFAWQTPPGARNQFLTVANQPAVGTPGWEAGFRQGQSVAALQVGGVQQPFDKDRWVALLSKPVPGRELLVRVSYQGRAIDLYTTISHDPLWTLYPQFDRHWVIWTPPGNFEVSSITEGLARVEFHVNLGGDPAIQPGAADKGSLRIPAAHFQNRYLNARYREQPTAPGGVEIVTRGGASGGNATAPMFPVVDRVVRLHKPDPPREAYLPPTLDVQIDGQTVLLTAQPNGIEPIAELQLWLNGKLLAKRETALDKSGKPPQLSATLRPEWLRAGNNHLVGVAGITAQGGRVYSRSLRPLPATAQAATRQKLHYLGVGVTRLGLQSGQLTELRYTGNDVLELAAALKLATMANQPFELGSMATLVDAKDCTPPTEANIRGALASLAQAAGPNDLAIVFFAGHGVNSQTGFRLIAQDTTSANAGISDQEIETQLSALPCRSLLMLDTCHAEGVEIERQVLDWPGLQLGPQIVAACGASQTSIELPGVGFGAVRAGHGLFTAALLEPLLGKTAIPARSEVAKEEMPVADSNADGQLTVDEWCAYACARTPQLAARLPERRKQQNPTVVPSITFGDAGTFVLARLGSE